MTQCLERVLASDYEKIEIIVFDDSSDDETSVLIRSFAQSGVRFVPGKELPAGWLGKNHALDILAQEASGTYVVFMDVDTFIEPTTISRLVRYMTTAKKDMVSVIPSRSDAWRSSVLFGSLRYYWQLVFSTPSSPAATGAFWAVNLDKLNDMGGISPHKNDVLAEARLAKQAGSSYRCLLDHGRLGINYEKKWRSQMETSRRILYPVAKGRSLVVLVGLLVLNLPTVAVAVSLASGWNFAAILASVVLLAFMGIYTAYARTVWRRNWWLGGLLWPVIILQEFVVFLLSIIGYWRGSITWKGRSLTAPVSRANSYTIDR